jgi:hypothetical protein
MEEEMITLERRVGGDKITYTVSIDLWDRTCVGAQKFEAAVLELEDAVIEDHLRQPRGLSRRCPGCAFCDSAKAP